MQRNLRLNHEEYNYELLTAVDILCIEHKQEDISHECVFFRFHENATNRDSIRLNTNKFDNMGLFSPKHITHGEDVAGPT